MIQSWLRRNEGDFDMADDEVAIPPIAVMPEPKHHSPPSDDPQSPAINGEDEQAKTYAAAAIMVNQFKQEREKLQILCAESTLAVEGSNRRVASLELENAELRNNLQALQSQCEMLRQEASDLRAFFSSIKAQLDHFEIPLPIRKRAHKLKPENGDKL